MASRRGSASLAPFKGAKRRRITSARSDSDNGSVVKLDFKISRASSIERPCSAARTRKRALSDSSKRRMIIVVALSIDSGDRKPLSRRKYPSLLQYGRNQLGAEEV